MSSPIRLGRATVRGVPRYVLASGIAVFAAFPFVFMVLASFKNSGEFLSNPFLLPKHPTFENFRGLLTAEFGRFFLNSIIIAAVTVTATVVLGALAAYPLARIQSRINGPLLLVFLFGLMVPVHVTLIPVYVLTRQLGLYDSIAALFGPFIAFSLPITVWVLVNFFKQAPEALMSAAKVDGAGHWTLFRRILIPLAAPALSTVAIINFIFVWNEFIFALILLSSERSFPIPLGLQQFTANYRVNVPGVMAALTAASVPTILFFLVAQEKVVAGLSAGALNGE